MKRKLLSLFLLLCLFLPLLTGCHGSQSRTAFSVPAVFDESTPITLTFWAKNDTNKNQTDVYEKAIQGFQALYPNVTVNMRLYTDYSRIYNDVITNISTDTTPDVCITYPDHIATYLTGSNVVVPLDELMADPEYGLGGSQVKFDSPKKEEIVPQFLQECVIGNHTWALPFMRSTEALYINKTWVERLGYSLPEVVTWDFIWEVSEAAMAKNEDGTFALNGQNVLIPFIYKSTDNMMITMLQQLNAPYSTAQGEVLLFNDTTSSLLKEIYTHGKSRAFSTFAISSYPANFLNAGQCIFAVDSTAGSTWMGCHAPLLDIPKDQLIEFETAVYPVPQADPENPKMISQGPSVCIFSKPDQQQVLASWLFVQYLLSNEIQLGYSQTEGYVPVTLKAQQSAEYQDYLARGGEDNQSHYEVKIAASRLLLSHPEQTFVTPVFNGSASLRSAAGQLIEATVKSARRKEEMSDEYLAKLYGDVTSLYRLDQIKTSGQTAADKPLPAESKALLWSLAAVWATIGVLTLLRLRKKQKAEAKK